MLLSCKPSCHFEVLVDAELEVTRKFGLLHPIPASVSLVYERFGVETFRSKNNSEFELMVHAIYEINPNHQVIYSRIDSDNQR